MKKKSLVYPALIAALFFGTVQTVSANPNSDAAVAVESGLIYDAANRVIGSVRDGIVYWQDGSKENAQQAELETGLDFDDDGDANGDGYNPR